jgi:hypothetical protein
MNLFIATVCMLTAGPLMAWWYAKLYRVMCDYLGAHDALSEWRELNPGVYLGLSETGKALLRRTIETYDQFLQYHPYVRDEGYREILLSLYDDLPPLRRKPKPRSGAFCLQDQQNHAIIAPTYANQRRSQKERE